MINLGPFNYCKIIPFGTTRIMCKVSFWQTLEILFPFFACFYGSWVAPLKLGLYNEISSTKNIAALLDLPLLSSLVELLELEMTLTISFDGMSSWAFPQTNLQVVLHDFQTTFTRRAMCYAIKAISLWCQSLTKSKLVQKVYFLIKNM